MNSLTAPLKFTQVSKLSWLFTF